MPKIRGASRKYFLYISRHTNIDSYRRDERYLAKSTCLIFKSIALQLTTFAHISRIESFTHTVAISARVWEIKMYLSHSRDRGAIRRHYGSSEKHGVCCWPIDSFILLQPARTKTDRPQPTNAWQDVRYRFQLQNIYISLPSIRNRNGGA